MITVTVRSLHPAGVVERAIGAPTIERAVEIAGGDAASAAVVFPIDGEGFFGVGGAAAAARPAAPEGTRKREHEAPPTAGLTRPAVPGPPRYRPPTRAPGDVLATP